MTDLFDAQAIMFSFVLFNAVACGLLFGMRYLSGAQSNAAFYPGANETYRENVTTDDRLFFSIHIPTYNEPPDVVMATLEHVAALTYDRFEVIILDNNTTDEALWQPVKALCDRLGPRFRFFHYDNVIGAKAGALNIAATLTAPDATHFAIVDADYQVTPDFLTSAAASIRQSGANFIQFPQAYRDHGHAQSVATELADYFLTVASGTNRQQAMLLTGTLSIISRAAFDDVGGWSGKTITEDAELGVRLYLGKYRGAYIHKTVGYGMLPLDFLGLVKQRERWVAGNLQTLIVAIRAGLLPLNKPALVIWTQLTAWVCLGAIPAFALLLLAILPKNETYSNPTAFLAGATLFVSLLSNPVRARDIDIDHAPNFSAWLRVRGVKLALLWTSSLAWVPAVFGATPIFQRTPKSRQGRRAFFMPKLALVSALFGCVAVVHIASGNLVAGVASSVLALCWLAARCVETELSNVSLDHQQGHAA